MFVRKLFSAALAICLAVPLLAGPILTTIQDMVYNANGTPYNGFAVINWTPFVAGDTSQIATQSVTVNITGGNLYVQLVPTTNATPAGYYTVTFTSAGNDQFTETWAVPPAWFHCACRMCSCLQNAGSSSLITGNAPMPESNVIGLLADLAVRPGRPRLCGGARGRDRFRGPARRHIRQCFGLRARGWFVGTLRTASAGSAGRTSPIWKCPQAP